MPRPTRSLRAGGGLALVALLATVPPAALHAALASAAGTVFEALPFVLVSALVRRPIVARIVPLAGCGCGPSGGPAALSLPAAALCWLAFGPLVAVLRMGGGLLVLLLSARRTGPSAALPDPLAELEGVGLAAFGLALGLETLGAHPGPALAHPLGELLSFGAGLLAGAFAPCTTAAIGAAAMLRGAHPLATAGLLASAGLIRVPQLHLERRPLHDGRCAFALAALGGALLVARGGAGFVNPRLVPLLAAGAFACVWAVRGATAQTRARSPIALALALLVALALGSPAPRYDASATTLDQAFAGEHLHFVGAVQHDGQTSRLVRFVITCCRADATPVVVPTLRRFPVAEGAWVEADGAFENGRDGVALHVATWHAVSRPADPFLYR
jgi:hypothetical protein